MQKFKQYMQNINVNREYFSLRFLVSGVILTVAFFLLSINLFRTYTSSITILINAKSEIAAEQEQQIVGNMVELPKMLAFYDRLLKFNPDVRDVAAGKSQEQRKEIWNRMLSVKRIGKDTSLIRISITAKQKNDADQLVQKTTRNLLDTAAMYYDVKNDIDLRIINGPVSQSAIGAWYLMLLLAATVGFLIAFLLQYVLAKSRNVFSAHDYVAKGKSFFDFNFPTSEKTAQTSEEEIKSLESLYVSEQQAAVIPEKSSAIQDMKKFTKMLEPDKYPNFPEMPVHVEKKAGAPDNLPIADESFFMQPEAKVEEQILSEPTEAENIETGEHPEPTQDQLKERLNKLLRGEF